ncbi:MAG TPA: hypothetical protein DCW90_09075 [Lachnospiraceae bacterium]|nr:hypothetical protein [Lachnospiraceae bacterium]
MDKEERNTVNFNLPKIDAFLKLNEKYFQDGEYISFEKELLLINEFTTMVVHYMKTFELLCTIHDTGNFNQFVDGLNSLYHQFLKNVLMNERSFDLMIKRYTEVKKLCFDTFNGEIIF